MAIKIKDLELTEPLKRVDPEPGYDQLWLLLRFRGEPFAWLKYYQHQLPVSPYRLFDTIKEDHSWNLYRRGLNYFLGLEHGLDGIARDNFGRSFEFDGLAQDLAAGYRDGLSPFSVLITQAAHCGELEPCLRALRSQIYPDFELILIDEKPDGPSEVTARLAAAFEVRVVAGEEALVKGVNEARHDCIALTSTAAVVDEGWLFGLARALGNNPNVVACTGPHLPLELETTGQLMAHKLSGHPDHLDRYYCYDRLFHYTPDKFGSWLNAAFRRDFLTKALAESGVKNQGQSLLPLFYSALGQGQIVAYDPWAVVRERYERDEKKAVTWAESMMAAQQRFMLDALERYPQEQKDIRSWLDKDKRAERRRSKSLRYARRIRRIIRNLSREIQNARAS